MSDDVTAGLAALRDEMQAGFARMDRYFELQQAQFLDWRAELRGEVQELRGEVQELRMLLLALTERVDRLEVRLTAVEESVQRLDHEVRALRDSTAREFANIRSELRLLRHDAAERDAALRQDVDALTTRVDRLEQRLEENPG